MNKFRLIIRYFNYFLASKKKITYPDFLNELVTVILDTTPSSDSENIETLRKKLLKNKKYISITDFGAGSIVNCSKKRRIKDIAQNTCLSKKHGALLCRLVDYFKPKILLELGTSIGLSALYLANSCKSTKVITFEGCTETAKIAQENFNQLQFKNIEIVIGNFDTYLPLQLSSIKQLDFVFFDGNHRKAPTISYFQQCLEKAHQDSVFIFADIYWSEEMEEAWQEIKNHPEVTFTIDLFFLGIVFFKENRDKKNYVIKF